MICLAHRSFSEGGLIRLSSFAKAMEDFQYFGNDALDIVMETVGVAALHGSEVEFMGGPKTDAFYSAC